MDETNIKANLCMRISMTTAKTACSNEEHVAIRNGGGLFSAACGYTLTQLGGINGGGGGSGAFICF